MKFLSKLLHSILRKNLLVYNLLVTFSVIVIFFIIFVALSVLLILAATGYAKAVGFAASLILENIIVALALPIIIGLLDFIFCILLLFSNLKLTKSEQV